MASKDSEVQDAPKKSKTDKVAACPHGAPSRGACDRCTAEDEAAAA